MKHNDKYHPSDQLIFRSLEEGEFELTSNRLVNLRSRQFASDHKAQLHYHNTIEINVNHGVEGSLWIDGNKEDLKNISVLVTPPGTMHAFDFCRGNGTFDVLHISLTRLGEYLNLEKILGKELVDLKQINFIDQVYNSIGIFIDEMKEIDEKDIFSQLRVILTILGTILYESKSDLKENSNSPFLKNVIDFTEKNYDRKIDLDEISSYAGLSRSYFSRFFKKTTGTGYFTYLTLMRLERAKEMIRSGKSVTESCLSCGFDNISYFIQLFKKHNSGISPGKFKEE